MKVLVAYYSESGNTEKLARAIYDGMENVEKEIRPIKEIGGVAKYELIFFGFPVQLHGVPGKAESFLKNIPEGKKLSIFATHGSLRGGHLAETAFHHAMTLVPKGKILGTFGCRGEVKSSVLHTLTEKPEYKGWAVEAQSAAGHPDQADLEDGKEFARKMVTKASTR